MAHHFDTTLSKLRRLEKAGAWSYAEGGNWSGTQVALNDFRLILDLPWIQHRSSIGRNLTGVVGYWAYIAP